MKPQKKELAKIIITPEGDYDVNKEYCPLSIVNSNYKTYISKTQVPKGIPVENEDYWMNIASGPSGTIDEITVEVNNEIGIPEAEIELDGTPQNRIFHLKFKNIKGEKGDKGDKGETGNFKEVIATVDANVGTPSVTTDIEGDNDNKVVTFNFKNIKGEKGDKGDKGDKGNKGDKGEPFVYDDLTDEQKAEINGVGIVTEQGGVIFLNAKEANRFSMACGDSAKAPGQWAVSFGYLTEASGDYSFAGGYKSIASNNTAIAYGYNATASGDKSIALGDAAKATSSRAIAIGYKAESSMDSVSIGYQCKSLGRHCISIGYMNNTLADGAVTLGIQNEANGGNSFCCGINNTTNGPSAFSMGDGNNAKGNASIAFNRKSICNAHNGSSFGYSTLCNSYSGFAIGYVNESDEETQTSNYNVNNIAFCIGNGIDNDGELIRSNAFKIKFDGTVYSDNTSIQPNADYAEMFEWNDGNESNEDRVGYFVTLIGNKIIKANTNSKYILGIISSTPSIIGNAPMRWQGKYLNDEWGRPIYENIEVTYTETISEQDENGEIVFKEIQKTRTDNVRKINPDYNPDQEYIPRENRKEWDAVGLLGKLLVRQDGTLIAGEFCYPNADGIATKSESGYYVTKIINENIAEVIFK